MRKKIRTISWVLLVALVAIQFIQPKKNLGEVTSDHLFNQEKVPVEVQTILKNSCFDCHSNHTNYLWYHQIAPVSWLVSSDIKDGKKEVNFSEWGQIDVVDKIGDLDDICKEVKKGDMPIKSYTIMHKNARLSKAQVDTLCAWSEKLSEDLLTRN
jgi:hypothetical protein